MLLRIVALTLALLAPAAAHAEWHEASSKHFLVYSDDKPERIRAYAEELEKFDRAMRLRYNIADAPISPANRLTVYVVSSETNVARLAGIQFAAGLYVRRAGGNLAIVPRSTAVWDYLDNSARIILQHEYAHHVMFSLSNIAVPSWFSEGFAEFWGTARPERDGSIVIGAAPQHRGIGLHWDKPIPASRLLTQESRFSSDQLDAFYGRSWLLTHYLAFSTERKGQLGAYIAAINRGEALEKAAAAFGDLPKLDAELKRYLMRPRLAAVQLSSDVLKTGPVAVRKLSAGEAATMAVRIRSDRGVDEKAAQEVVIDARKTAAGHETDAAAQLALAEAEYDARNYALAEAAADRALAVSPNAAKGLLYKAMAKMKLAEAANDRTPATWTAIRRLIVAANKIEPDDPKPLILNYRSYGTAGQPATANAKAGLVQAYNLALSDYSLRWEVATMWIADAKLAEARTALAPIAYYPHGGATAERARDLIAAIDRRDPAEKILAIMSDSGK